MSYSEDRTYVLYINSADKVSGTNNAANFFVDWAQFLPVKYSEYKIRFSFYTIGGFYHDNAAGTSLYNTGKVAINFGTRQFCYDTASRGVVNTIGFITRDPQDSTTSTNVLSADLFQNPPKSITRPNQNLIVVNVTNLYSGLPLVTTDSTGATPSADMTAWQMAIEFIPISDSLIECMKFQNL